MVEISRTLILFSTARADCPAKVLLSASSANSPADPPRAGAHHHREKVRAALPAPIFAAAVSDPFRGTVGRLRKGAGYCPCSSSQLPIETPPSRMACRNGFRENFVP